MGAPRSRKPDEPPQQAEFTYRADQQILLARTRGVLPTSTWPEIIKQSIEQGTAYSCSRFLIDHREATFRLKFAELWALPHNMGAFRLPAGARVALLFSSMPAVQRQFIEAFNGNRGYNVKVFEDEALATSWLMEPDSKPNLLEFPKKHEGR